MLNYTSLFCLLFRDEEVESLDVNETLPPAEEPLETSTQEEGIENEANENEGKILYQVVYCYVLFCFLFDF